VNNLKLTLAIGDYDHTRDLALGRVRPAGIDLTVLNFDVEEIFFRFYDRLEWEVSEMSMGMYTSAISRGDVRMVAIPVFPSRVFRHSAIYVKGYLSATVGIPLSKISWVQAGLNDPGRDEHAELKLPAGIDLKPVRDRTLSEMLLAGEIDAISSARPPRPFLAGDPGIRRLFPDYRSAEESYFRQTGIFPIMHTIVMRRDAYEANRWVARNLLLAFEEARDRSVARILDVTASAIPVPWAVEYAERAGRSLGFEAGSYWPYGIGPNRTTLEAFLQYAFEQGTCHRLLRPEEIFAEEALAQIRV